MICGVAYSYSSMADPTLKVGNLEVRRKVVFVHGVSENLYFKVKNVSKLGAERRYIGGVMGDGGEVVDLRVLRNVGGLVVDMGVERGVPVELEVYDVTGRRVFRKAILLPGRRFEWLGEDMNGRRLRSGVYFYRLKVKERELRGKMILLD